MNKTKLSSRAFLDDPVFLSAGEWIYDIIAAIETLSDLVAGCKQSIAGDELVALIDKIWIAGGDDLVICSAIGPDSGLHAIE